MYGAVSHAIAIVPFALAPAAARARLAEPGRRRAVEVGVGVVAVAELRVATCDDRAVAQRHVDFDDERLACGEIGDDVIGETGQPIVGRLRDGGTGEHRYY